jgi:hypothetical protein
MRTFVAFSALLCAAGCGAAAADLSLNVTWSFLSGDCARTPCRRCAFRGVFRARRLKTSLSTARPVGEGLARSPRRVVSTASPPSASSRSATLKSVAPGSYVVELDSRAVTPKVKGTKPVTVLPGENATVDFQF